MRVFIWHSIFVFFWQFQNSLFTFQIKSLIIKGDKTFSTAMQLINDTGELGRLLSPTTNDSCISEPQSALYGGGSYFELVYR